MLTRPLKSRSIFSDVLARNTIRQYRKRTELGFHLLDAELTLKQAFFVAGLRTPFGRAGKGAFRDYRPDDLMVELLSGHRLRFPQIWKNAFNDFVLGCAYPEGEQGYNVARMIALGADLSLPGTTINRLCASSIEAVANAAARVRSDWGNLYLVGGLESMSRVPRRGANFSESDRIKQLCSMAYTPNGETAERVAQQYPQLDRLAQEDFAARSHELADAAYANGSYADQLFPVFIDRDEFIRVPVDRDKMASLPPAFSESGVVTAATSSPLTDGACCGVVCDLATAQQMGVKSALEIIDVTVSHVAPEVMGLGPVPSTTAIFARNNITARDLAAVEINEAFAIQVLASLAELQIPLDIVNNWGGAIALGHPLGASGLRLVMTLHHRLERSGQADALGLVTLCVGGGQGMSLLARLVSFN